MPNELLRIKFSSFFVMCKNCGAESPKVPLLEDVEEAAKLDGWRLIGGQFLCPNCTDTKGDKVWNIVVITTQDDEEQVAVVDTAHSPIEACAKFNGLTRGIRLPDFCGGEFQGIQDSHWIEQASLGKNSLLVSLLAEDGQRYELRYSPDP